MILPIRIKAWRSWADWSLQDVADKLDVSAAAVSMWESTGKHGVSPSQKNLEAFVAALGITMQQFYGPVPKKKRAA